MTNLPPPTFNSGGEPPAKDFKQAKAESKAAKARTRALRPWFRKKRFIIPIVLFGLPTLTSLFNVGSNESEESKDDAAATSVTVATIATTTVPLVSWSEIIENGLIASEVSQSICSDLDSMMKKQLKIVNDRLGVSEKPAADAFDSADYLKTIDWSEFKHRESIISEQLAISDPALIEVSSIAPNAIQLKEFLNDTLVSCSLDQDSLGVLAAAFKLDGRLSNMRVNAENLPWYPKGYSTYSGDIAWRWLEGKEFRCSYGDRCWGISIIAKKGCPTSLYAEITILNGNGANIGYTNDLTSGLSSGQEARLVFEDFTPGAASARLSEISCY